MSMGGNYVRNREYEQERMQYQTLMASAANTTSTAISSGASIVRGIYYMWNDQGFTGHGWKYSVEGGPTNMYPGFHSDADVADYVAANDNLDAVFSYWAQHYTLEGWDNFYNAVGISSGCMNVDHGQA